MGQLEVCEIVRPMSSNPAPTTTPTAENGTVLTGVPTQCAGANIHGLGHYTRPSCSMPARTTLARLGKLVAADVRTGRAGANSWAASQALQADPEAVLDLIEMLLVEGRKTRPNEKLVSAYVYMIGQALEFIRMAAENGQASAQGLADAARRTLLQAGTSGLVQPVLLVMILMEFSNAKLDPGADLQHLMANLLEQIGLGLPCGAPR